MTFGVAAPCQSSASALRDRVRPIQSLELSGYPQIGQAGRPITIKPVHSNGPDAGAIVFGRFRLDLRSRELFEESMPVQVGDRALDVLIVLIEARGELVTKDQLLSRVWGRTAVEENNLQFHVSRLRKAFGKDRGIIKTVSGRGYRFAVRVTILTDEEATDAKKNNGSFERLRDFSPLSNLPSPMSDVVGREAHIAAIASLAEANRLVTLVGAGGIGKTRLGTEVARRLAPSFDDGVYLIELGLVSDPGLVAKSIATVLQLSVVSATPESLATVLASKNILLLLDNCEHLIDACASIAEVLLHASARLKVIATSREPLRADGECVYRVPPLDVPTEGSESIEDELRYSAVKLFLTRMRAAEPGQPLDAQLVVAAAKICRRLDGIPLAIELAATRAATLGVEELVSRFDDWFSLLTNGRRTAPLRHQTLRATLDWSYELLSEREQVILRRLSVLSGEFSMRAAGAVAASGQIVASDVVQCVMALVARSLIASDIRCATSRFRLLETVRAYALEKLIESREFETVSRRYSEFVRDQLECPKTECGGRSRAELIPA